MRQEILKRVDSKLESLDKKLKVDIDKLSGIIEMEFGLLDDEEENEEEENTVID